MLPKLLLREWILSRRALVAIVGIFLLFQVYFVYRVGSPRQFLIFASIYASFLTLTLFLREDKFRAAAWSCTLPVSRRDLVRARFVGAWIFVAGVLALTLILAGVMPGSTVQPSAVLEPATLLMAAATITVILALMFPFTIRFGMLGVMIFLVGIQILGSVVLLIAVSVGGRGRASSGVLSGGTAVLQEAIVALRVLLSPPVFYVAAALFLILVNWLGYRLAVELFRRREL